jgi:Trypsin-co-occurring domain 2
MVLNDPRKKMNKKKVSDSIGLNELIYQVKRELLCPSPEDVDPVPIFAVDEIQLEIAVTVRKEGQGGINIQVLSVGGAVASEDVHVVRVTLKPLRTREELYADLRAMDPALVEHMTKETLKLLKGQQEPGQQKPGVEKPKQKLSWP